MSVAITPQRIKKFQEKVLTYYKEQGRDLPWRKTTNPYFILLSEVMLQQTQVERGKQYYLAWTTKWPTLADLANASREEVLHMWMGLGYNNRAINLHKTAQKIIEEYHGDICEALLDFKNLPGIGPYTAAAVRIFALNADEVTVDTNIRRIFIAEFSLDEKTSDKELWELAERCLPKRKSRDWHNGLMDYGALHLTARKTGIKPKTTQSAFKGSDREIRAKILRLLLKEKKISIDSLYTTLFPQQTLLEKKHKEQKERLERILHKLQKDDVVLLEKKKVVLQQ